MSNSAEAVLKSLANTQQIFVESVDAQFYQEAEIQRLARLLNSVEGAWVLLVIRDEKMRLDMQTRLFKLVKARPVVEISLAKKTPDPLQLIKESTELLQNPSALVCFTDVGRGFPDLFGYLDLQRDTLAQFPHHLLFWLTRDELTLLAYNAPNFYSRISGAFDFVNRYDGEIKENLPESIAGFNKESLYELFNRYEARVYSYIYRRTGNESLAEGLTAQVFLKMLEAIRSDKAWHSSFSGWLYRIAHNAVIDYYRQRDQQQQVSLEDTLTTTASDHNPVVMADVSLDAERLRIAISRLTEEQAEVITLRFLEGYSISEVAEMLDKTEGSIKALQYRAVTTLRQLLQHEGSH